MTKSKSGPSTKQIAANRRARYEYDIEDTLEVGVVLTGTEVKSLRQGQANIAEAYISVENGELWLINGSIPPYNQARTFNHEERRPRKLLAHLREISRLNIAVSRKGMTLIALKMYFTASGRVKLLLGIARGKKVRDKRESEKARDWGRQQRRLLKQL